MRIEFEKFSVSNNFFCFVSLFPLIFAYAKTGAYVPNSDNTTVSVIDTSADNVIATVTVDNGPLAVTMGFYRHHIFSSRQLTGTPA